MVRRATKNPQRHGQKAILRSIALGRRRIVLGGLGSGLRRSTTTCMTVADGHETEPRIFTLSFRKWARPRHLLQPHVHFSAKLARTAVGRNP